MCSVLHGSGCVIETLILINCSDSVYAEVLISKNEYQKLILIPNDDRRVKILRRHGIKCFVIISVGVTAIVTTLYSTIS